MPNFRPETLRQIGREFFEAAGCRPADAAVVVDHLVESNLFGHDSHGAIRFYDYGRGIREGRYQTQATPVIERQTDGTAVVDGQGALGPIGATYAAELAIDKARRHGIAAVALRNTSHIGRVGAYPLMAARQGFVAQVMANAGRLGFEIAPFGGIDGRLSSNPVAFAAPRRDADPVMMDMTTSVAAVGKIWVAENRGQQLPEGWIIDAEGCPTTEPKDFTAEPRGAMLPLGGVAAHKGFGLSVMVELLGGALGGQGCAAGEREVVSNGVLMTVYRIDQFTDASDYYDQVESLIGHVKSSRLAPGFDQILFPGEVEFAHARRKMSDGIDLEATTWQKICVEAQRFGLDLSHWE